MVWTDGQPASWWLAGLPRSSSSRPRLEPSVQGPSPVAREDERSMFVRSSVSWQRQPAQQQPWAQPRASEARRLAPAAPAVQAVQAVPADLYERRA